MSATLEVGTALSRASPPTASNAPASWPRCWVAASAVPSTSWATATTTTTSGSARSPPAATRAATKKRSRAAERPVTRTTRRTSGGSTRTSKSAPTSAHTVGVLTGARSPSTGPRCRSATNVTPANPTTAASSTRRRVRRRRSAVRRAARLAGTRRTLVARAASMVPSNGAASAVTMTTGSTQSQPTDPTRAAVTASPTAAPATATSSDSTASSAPMPTNVAPRSRARVSGPARLRASSRAARTSVRIAVTSSPTWSRWARPRASATWADASPSTVSSPLSQPMPPLVRPGAASSSTTSR